MWGISLCSSACGRRTGSNTWLTTKKKGYLNSDSSSPHQLPLSSVYCRREWQEKRPSSAFQVNTCRLCPTVTSTGQDEEQPFIFPAFRIHWRSYSEKTGSRCLSAPPTRWRLPVIRTWISVAERSGAALTMMLGFTFKTLLSELARTESLPWLIHCRALRMQGNTSVSAFFCGTRDRESSMSSCRSSLLWWRHQLLSLSRQRVSMFSTDTLKFCWSEGTGLFSIWKKLGKLRGT